MYVCMSVQSLDTSKMMGFAWDFAHLFFGRFFYFSKIFIFGAWGRVFSQNEAKTLGQPGDLKNDGIWLKFYNRPYRSFETVMHNGYSGISREKKYFIWGNWSLYFLRDYFLFYPRYNTVMHHNFQNSDKIYFINLKFYNWAFK